MSADNLIAARRTAEEAVAGMAEGPIKLKAFEVILGSLLSAPLGTPIARPVTRVSSAGNRLVGATSLAARVQVLASEGFFSEPKSLSEIQRKLIEHGWHYPQANLSTPLVRLVRQRQLRRLQQIAGGKKVWKYSLP
jgi:hypothetical protein